MSFRNGSGESARGAPDEQRAPRSPTGGRRLLLSILIPAYRYPEGVARILGGLGTIDPELIEVLISDDSPDAAVEDVVRRANLPGVSYRRNSPSLGAPGNWNSLLDAARGRYCWLLHHDEFPLSKHFVSRMLERLRNAANSDVLILDCILVEPRTGRNRRHLPNWLRRWVAVQAPAYFFRRNVVGPTSALVVRRDYYPRFDENLRWLVDMEVYAMLFLAAPRLQLCPDLAVGSILGRTESITAQLAGQISDLARRERLHLLEKHEPASRWLGPGSWRGARRMGEAALWKLLRVATRLTAIVSPYGRSEAKIAVDRGKAFYA